MKIVSVVGARPQFIKAAVVSRVLRQRPDTREILLHTGQHYDDNLSPIFFRELAMPAPDYNLNVGSDSQGAQTGRMLAAIEEVLVKERPDWVLVYGDTNSTLAGALAAAKLDQPVAHVEAGLRSFARQMPEEINRVVTDHLSELLFAPTNGAIANLAREGIDGGRVHLVGDVMYDAALFYSERAERLGKPPESYGVRPEGFILATIHRAENTEDGTRLRNIFAGLARVAEDMPVLLPIHPRTRAALRRADIAIDPVRNLKLIDPLGYLDMVRLEKNARLVVTDSGGVQKEAFFCGVPCATLRERTEWVELVELGWNRLVPPLGAEQIAEEILDALATAKTVEALAGAQGPYGDGRAAQRIVDALYGR